MKFSHLADCHIGSWRDEKLNNISTEAFIKALDISLQKQVDFILIAGDIFNTSLPPIEKLKAATKKLREVKEHGVSVYIIPGSHDFSPSGKTMLDVLEHAGLLINVFKGTVTENNTLQLLWTVDKKTGAKMTGILGKKGSLERKYYEHLERERLEQEDGFKIFLFHTALAELKPADLEKMEAEPLSFLPKNCDYYAGGHMHIVQHASFDSYKNIIYPGPLFPNSFAELEKLKSGGFYLYDNGSVEYIPIQIHPAIAVTIHAGHESSAHVEVRLYEEIEKLQPQNAIVTIRICGELSEGKASDIDFKKIKEMLEQKGAYAVLKSTTQLRTKEFDEIQVKGRNTEEIEEKILQEHLGQFSSESFSKEQQEQIGQAFVEVLNTEKQEGERVIDFEKRILAEMDVLLRPMLF